MPIREKLDRFGRIGARDYKARKGQDEDDVVQHNETLIAERINKSVFKVYIYHYRRDDYGVVSKMTRMVAV